jgi:hypothetical protein
LLEVTSEERATIAAAKEKGALEDTKIWFKERLKKESMSRFWLWLWLDEAARSAAATAAADKLIARFHVVVAYAEVACKARGFAVVYLREERGRGMATLQGARFRTLHRSEGRMSGGYRQSRRLVYIPRLCVLRTGACRGSFTSCAAEANVTAALVMLAEQTMATWDELEQLSEADLDKVLLELNFGVINVSFSLEKYLCTRHILNKTRWSDFSASLVVVQLQP